MSDTSRIVFCGVGALGSSAAVFCRNLNAQLAFIDFDRVESKNVLAQAYVKQSIGKNKADALKLQFLNFYGVKVDAFGVRIDSANVAQLCGDASIILDCFDNIQSRRVLSEYARANGKALLHAAISADGTFGVVRWDERFAPDAEDTEGAATCEGGEHLPLIGVMGSTIARTVQDFLKSGVRRDSMVSLNAVTQTAG